MKWLIATILALILFSGFSTYLRRFGLGKLPGDFNLKIAGRSISVPLSSTLILSAIGYLVMRLL